MRVRFTLLCLLLLCWGVRAQDSLRFSVITCAPGPEIYELYGHTALRVEGKYKGQEVDAVFNYGLFDFNSPGFIPRFIKGNLRYLCGIESTPLFLSQYEQAGRRVTQQNLALNSAEADSLMSLLVHDASPEYCEYDYKYFSNNCTTIPLARIRQATSGRVNLKSEYRFIITDLEEFDRNYPWYHLGITTALPVPKAKSREKSDELAGSNIPFIPVRMSQALDGAQKDGKPLVSGQTLLVAGRGDQRQAATPFILRPISISLLLLVLVIAILFVSKRRGKEANWLRVAWFLLIGLVGCVVCYLNFFSTHYGAGRNILVLWLNPLWIFAACAVPVSQKYCALRWFVLALSVLPLTLLVMALAGVVRQYMEPTLYVCLLITVILGLSTPGVGDNLCRITSVKRTGKG